MASQDFMIGIFRLAEPANLLVAEQASERERYIAVFNHIGYPEVGWFVDKTLFGLQKQAKNYITVDWEQVERELRTAGAFTVPHPQK